MHETVFDFRFTRNRVLIDTEIIESLSKLITLFGFRVNQYRSQRMRLNVEADEEICHE